jgi:SAM-dependent methyltransferase
LTNAPAQTPDSRTDRAAPAAPPQPLARLYRHFDEFRDAAVSLREHLGRLEGLRVLEAGCGAQSNLDLGDCEVTGIDISPEQLDRNTSLREKVCADLHHYESDDWARRFDLIVCWDVLEHLTSPRVAVGKFGAWSRPGAGRLVIVGPNPRSLKAWTTKHTPYFFHRLFYRLTIGTPLRAREGARGPFKTVFSDEIDLEALASLLAAHSFEITLLLSFESFQNKWVKRFMPPRVVDALNRRLLGSLGGFLSPAATDFIIVARRGD